MPRLPALPAMRTTASRVDSLIQAYLTKIQDYLSKNPKIVKPVQTSQDIPLRHTALVPVDKIRFNPATAKSYTADTVKNFYVDDYSFRGLGTSRTQPTGMFYAKDSWKDPLADAIGEAMAELRDIPPNRQLEDYMLLGKLPKGSDVGLVDHRDLQRMYTALTGEDNWPIRDLAKTPDYAKRRAAINSQLAAQAQAQVSEPSPVLNQLWDSPETRLLTDKKIDQNKMYPPHYPPKEELVSGISSQMFDEVERDAYKLALNQAIQDRYGVGFLRVRNADSTEQMRTPFREYIQLRKRALQKLDGSMFGLGALGIYGANDGE